MIRALLALAALSLAPAACAAALLEDEPGRAVVQAGPGARLVAEAGAEVRFAPPGEVLGNWSATPPEGVPLGEGGCENGLCGLHVVEVRAGEARVVEGRAGVLLRPAEAAAAAPAVADAPEEARPPPGRAGARLPVPGFATAAAAAALGAAALARRRFV